MKNLLNLTESEKSRILNLHKSAIKKEFLFEQRMDTEGKNVEMYNNDKDYDYKKENDKYFFKLKATPKSEKAKALLAQKKFINWTEAKNKIALDAIKKLPFQAVAPPPPNTDGSDETFEPPVQTTNTATTPTTSNTPVKYPWIGADGKSSLENLQKAKTTDPNFNNWLGELKKLSPPQLIKVKLDLSKFKEQISKSGIDVKSDQSYLVAYQAIADAQKFVGEQPTI